jgi:predicted dehydrogenase
MVNAADAAKRVVQIGFQRRHNIASAQAADYIRQGLAGKIVQVDAQINYTAPLESSVIQDPPASLDWDLWCGPAPKLPYCPNIGHRAWRLEVNYGNGHMVDWGIHWLDAIRRMLGLKAPDTVEAMGGIFRLRDKITTPDVLVAQFEFESLPVIWRHRLWGAVELDPSMNNRAVFYGEKETVLVTDDRWAVMPSGKGSQMKVIEAPPAKPGVLHMMNFLECVRSRQTPICEPLDGYLSTLTPQLGMIAYQVGAKIRWDAQKEQILDNPNANKLLKREYRLPWKHPAKGMV